MKRWMIIALAVPVLLLGGFWFGEPYIAMNRLQSALERADEAELERMVDFEALRTAMRAELKEQLRRQRRSGSVKGAFVGAMAMRNLGPTIDGFLTPQGLIGLMRPEELDMELRPERAGLHDFTVWAASQQGRENGLVFERQGSGWRLVSIKLNR